MDCGPSREVAFPSSRRCGAKVAASLNADPLLRQLQPPYMHSVHLHGLYRLPGRRIQKSGRAFRAEQHRVLRVGNPDLHMRAMQHCMAQAMQSMVLMMQRAAAGPLPVHSSTRPMQPSRRATSGLQCRHRQ